MTDFEATKRNAISGATLRIRIRNIQNLSGREMEIVSQLEQAFPRYPDSEAAE